MLSGLRIKLCVTFGRLKKYTTLIKSCMRTLRLH
nr:MAG TPA: hypothetical protein [Caudoviricetes sp.]